MISIIKHLNDYELKNELWSGALDTLEVIIENNKFHSLISLLQELFPEPTDITTINDFIWFDEDFIYEQLNIVVDDYSYEKKL